MLAVDASVSPRGWNTAGRYTTAEPGRWLVMKLFIPVPPAALSGSEEEEHHCEVFLAINVVEGTAELTPKASDYGRPLLAALSQVL